MISLVYPDGSLYDPMPKTLEVDALPPLGTEVNTGAGRLVVSAVHLDIRGNKQSFWTVRLRAE